MIIKQQTKPIVLQTNECPKETKQSILFLLNFDCVVRERLSAEVTFEVRPKGREGASSQSTGQAQFLHEEHAGRNLATSRNCNKPFVAKAVSTCRGEMRSQGQGVSLLF